AQGCDGARGACRHPFAARGRVLQGPHPQCARRNSAAGGPGARARALHGSLRPRRPGRGRECLPAEAQAGMEERLSGGGAAVAGEAPAGELLADVRAGVATVTLNRPGALNALSFGMIEELPRLLDAWERDDAVRVLVLRGAGEKAFCAGGDIRMLHDSFRAGTEGHHDFFIREYALDHRIHRYPKPVVALVDGIVMGGGMGISQGAALRVVGDRTRMAMPETTIGLFPDVGGSYFLSRVPGRLG